MKAAIRYVIFGVVMYALFMLGTVPAAWLYSHGLQSRLPGIALYEIKGTLWEGRAVAVRTGTLQLENFHWNLHPWALLWGRMEAALSFDYQSSPAKMVMARSLGGDWYLRNVEMEMPAQGLVPMLRLPGAELGGNLSLHMSSLAIKQGEVKSATGQLDWEKAAISKPVSVTLGSFTLNIETKSDGVGGILMDHGGPVQAQGVLKLLPNGQYQLTATLGSRDPKQPLIAQGLRLFGNPGPDGRVKYSTSGRLPKLL